MSRIIVVYDDLVGYTLADGLIEDHVDELIEEFNTDNLELMPIIGSELMIDYFRLAVKKGKIDCDKVVFRLTQHGDDIPVNKDGRLSRWPNGFCDHLTDVLRQL